MNAADEKDKADDREKKERVIHTRISESLDEEIRERASRLGLSVSNLVRNVLLNTFGLVEDIVADSAGIARSSRQRAEGAPRSAQRRRHEADSAADAGILGWQEAILNRNAVCDSCNTILNNGAAAGIAVTEEPGWKTILCKPCLDKRISEEK